MRERVVTGRIRVLLLTALFASVCPALFAYGQKIQSSSTPFLAEGLTLGKILLCEEIQEGAPINQAVVFSSTVGKVFCYTAFDSVPSKTHIYHTWYLRDRASTKTRLLLGPPRWSTYSSIQLRESDKGPWRVEITDKEGKILGTIRFSVTD